MDDSARGRVIDQIRELSMLVIRVKSHVSRAGIDRGFGEGPSEADGFRASHGQGRLLAILMVADEISQRDLSYMLGMSRQAVGELLSKLEQKGYVVRTPDVRDRRTMTVRLTEAGRAAARRVRECGDVGSELLGCLNDSELAQLSGYLQRIIETTEARLPNDEFVERRRAMREFLAVSRAAERS